DDLARLIPLDPFRAGIPGNDVPTGIQHEDGAFLRAVDEQSESLLADPQLGRPFPYLLLQLRPMVTLQSLKLPALGRVTKDHDDAQDTTVAVFDRSGTVVHRPLRAVFRDEDHAVPRADDEALPQQPRDRVF